MENLYDSFIKNFLSDRESVLFGATDKELMILGRTKRARIRKKYLDRIIRRSSRVVS